MSCLVVFPRRTSESLAEKNYNKIGDHLTAPCKAGGGKGLRQPFLGE